MARAETPYAAGLERLKAALVGQLETSGLAAPDYPGKKWVPKMQSIQMTPHHFILPSDIQMDLEQRPNYGKVKGYKFLKKEHAMLAVSEGSIKIGSLNEFRRHENDLTRDDFEGKDTADVEFFGDTRLFSPQSIFRSVFNFEAENVAMSGVRIQNSAPDTYVYCFAYECTQSVAKSFPYDAVVQITDLYVLAETLIRYHPILLNHRYVCGPVRYCPRVRSPHDDNRHPIVSVFEKDHRFRDNVEGRLVFIKNDQAAEYLPPLDPWTHRRLRRFSSTAPFLCKDRSPRCRLAMRDHPRVAAWVMTMPQVEGCPALQGQRGVRLRGDGSIKLPRPRVRSSPRNRGEPQPDHNSLVAP